MEITEREIREEYEKRIRALFEKNGKVLRGFEEEIDNNAIDIESIVEEWSQ